eukprot:502402_1
MIFVVRRMCFVLICTFYFQFSALMNEQYIFNERVIYPSCPSHVVHRRFHKSVELPQYRFQMRFASASLQLQVINVGPLVFEWLISLNGNLLTFVSIRSLILQI